MAFSFIQSCLIIGSMLIICIAVLFYLRSKTQIQELKEKYIDWIVKVAFVIISQLIFIFTFEFVAKLNNSALLLYIWIFLILLAVVLGVVYIQSLKNNPKYSDRLRYIKNFFICLALSPIIFFLFVLLIGLIGFVMNGFQPIPSHGGTLFM